MAFKDPKTPLENKKISYDLNGSLLDLADLQTEKIVKSRNKIRRSRPWSPRKNLKKDLNLK